MDPLDQFVAIAHRVVWATVATVDRRSRPRSRVLHPIWARDGDAHRLGHHPADAAQGRPPRPRALRLLHVLGPGARHRGRRVRRRVGGRPRRPRRGLAAVPATRPEPLGYDFAQIFPDGPQSPGAGFLRMRPWRIRTHRVVAGEPAARLVGVSDDALSGTGSPREAEMRIAWATMLACALVAAFAAAPAAGDDRDTLRRYAAGHVGVHGRDDRPGVRAPHRPAVRRRHARRCRRRRRTSARTCGARSPPSGSGSSGRASCASAPRAR